MSNNPDIWGHDAPPGFTIYGLNVEEILALKKVADAKDEGRFVTLSANLLRENFSLKAKLRETEFKLTATEKALST